MTSWSWVMGCTMVLQPEPCLRAFLIQAADALRTFLQIQKLSKVGNFSGLIAEIMRSFRETFNGSKKLTRSESGRNIFFGGYWFENFLEQGDDPSEWQHQQHQLQQRWVVQGHGWRTTLSLHPALLLAHVHTRTHTHMDMHTHTHTYIHVHKNTPNQNTHTHIHTHLWNLLILTRCITLTLSLHLCSRAASISYRSLTIYPLNLLPSLSMQDIAADSSCSKSFLNENGFVSKHFIW